MNLRLTRRTMAAWAAIVPVTLLVIAACSGDPADPTVPPTQAPATQSSPSPVASQLQTALASSDLSVGPNRVVFGLIDSVSGPLRDANVRVSTFRLVGGRQEGPVETVEATFRKWPVGTAGVYTVRLSFDTSGSWGLGITVLDADGSTRTSSTRVQVTAKSSTPAIGRPAPRSVSKTVDDVNSLEQLTTDRNPDTDLYRMTIAEALDAGKPLMVTFSTPAFCSSATCGPQLDVVKEIKEQYKGRANFIHVEVYDNPHEIQGDLSNAIIAPALTEWNLPSEPWTFIVDGDGMVQAKFEAFTTREELENALLAVLQ